MAKPTVPRTCQHCQASFKCTPQQAQKGWGKFCSAFCARKCRPKVAITDLLMRHIIEDENGCWIWTGFKNRGYGKMRAGKEQYAHRASYEAFIGPIGTYDVLHRCDVPACINPAHLFLGTHQDNMDDSAYKERMHIKLTADKVRTIRNDPRPHSAIAKHYNLNQSTVSRIKAKKRRPLIK